MPTDPTPAPQAAGKLPDKPGYWWYRCLVGEPRIAYAWRLTITSPMKVMTPGDSESQNPADPRFREWLGKVADYAEPATISQPDPSESYRRVLNLMEKLVVGIEQWADQEDGVPTELFDGYRLAKACLLEESPEGFLAFKEQEALRDNPRD